MRIVNGDTRMTISDNPDPMWAFYSVFVLGGSTALGMSLFQSPGPTMTVLGSIIGIGNIAGGLFMMKREPASVVELDFGAHQVRVRRWGITGSAERSYPLDALLGADVETSTHSDGGPVFRPILRFSTSESVPVSMFWSQKPNSSQDVVAHLERHSRRPPDTPAIR